MGELAYLDYLLASEVERLAGGAVILKNRRDELSVVRCVRRSRRVLPAVVEGERLVREAGPNETNDGSRGLVVLAEEEPTPRNRDGQPSVLEVTHRQLLSYHFRVVVGNSRVEGRLLGNGQRLRRAEDVR